MTERLARTVKETAARLGVSMRTVWREIGAERIKAVKIGRRAMILAADEAAYLASRERVGAGEAKQ